MTPDMRNVSAIVLGGGKGTRLFPLTKERSKPAVPLAGQFRLIDIPLSNCINSHINKIYVVTQFMSHSLNRHVHSSFKFDIFNKGMIDILAASQNMNNTGWFQGTADAVRQNMQTVFENNEDGRALILSGDQIYKMDFRRLVADHEAKQSDVTIAVTVKPASEAYHFGCMKVDKDFRITKFVEKPSTDEQLSELIIKGSKLKDLGVTDDGDYVLISMGIYLFETPRLVESLNNDMQDFGKNIIPWAINNFNVFAYPFTGYWEDIGTISAFFNANINLTDTVPKFNFYDADKPIYTACNYLPSSKINGHSSFMQTIISDGTIIENSTVTKSIIGIRSVIREGCILNKVVMMGQDDYAPDDKYPIPRGIGKYCRITRAIIDKNACIGDNVIIEDQTGKPNCDGEFYYVRDGIVIIPKHAIVPSGTIIK